MQAEKERIRKDVKNRIFTWGLGGGLELPLKEGPSLIGGLIFQQSFNDVVRNKGHKAIEISEGEYEIQTVTSPGKG